MHIVYLAPFAFSPKATVSARMLPMAAALVRRGHRVTLLIPPYDNAGESGRAREHEGVRLENLTVGAGAAGPAQYWSLARRMADRARALNPDAIHAFKPIGVAALAFWLLGRQARRHDPRHSILDNDDWEGSGGWLDVNPYSPAQKAFFRWQERWALRAAATVTCASEALVARTRAMRDGRDDGIHLLPNGPDPAMRAQVAAAGARRDELRQRFGWREHFIVIYAGTIPLNHDLDLAVQAMRALAGAPGAPAPRWVIVATGDGIPSLRDAIARAGIGERVEWHGFMPHAQLVERLVAADAAVYPYRDTNINRAKCSGKVMDYMACGLPMVVSDVGMNRAYVEHGASGLLTPPGDAAAFAAALAQIVDDSVLAANLGRAAQRRIWERFGWDARADALARAYGA